MRVRKISKILVQQRIMLLLLIVIAAAMFLVGRLVYLQIVSNEFFQAKALEQRIQRIPVEGRRGTIYDRNGIPLAVSVSATSVYAVPAQVEDKEHTARVLSEILDLDYETVLTRLNRRTASEWIKKKVSLEETRAVLQANLPGVGVVDSSERIYPYGSVAPQVLGFVGIDNQGLEGLELYYDDVLRGKPGQAIFERDAVGRRIEDGVAGYLPGAPGSDLILTIDYYIQQVAQREVQRATLETGSRLGLIVITDPKTGEILANAIYPTFDIENFAEYPVQNRRNIAVTDTYEPGSTFKAVTAAIALEEGVATVNTGFFDPGYIRVSGWTIRCWNRGGHGPQSFFETLQNSCNPFYAKLGMELGGDKFYPNLLKWNFGSKMGVDFPGEVGGTVHPPSARVPLVTWANIGFGQGLTMTPLQLLAAFGAIANDGIYSVPHYVKEIVSEEGSRGPDIPPPRQVVSKETTDILRDGLRRVITLGSAKRAEAPGYFVAGKTGTAQVVENGRYSHSKTVTSFAGFAPVHDPQMAALIVLWEPKGAFYGGIIAAPVFSRLTQQVMPFLGVERQAVAEGGPWIRVPDVVGMTVDEGIRSLEEANFTVEQIGEGTRIIGQAPEPNARSERGAEVFIFTDTDYLPASTEMPEPFGV